MRERESGLERRGGERAVDTRTRAATCFEKGSVGPLGQRRLLADHLAADNPTENLAAAKKQLQLARCRSPRPSDIPANESTRIR